MSKRLIPLALLILTTAACSPIHFGASILNQSDVGAGSYDGPVYATPGHTPAQGNATMDAHVDEQSAAIVVTDYEHNGVADGNWSSTDHNNYYAMALKRERCTVMVKGWRTNPSQALHTARADIEAIADVRRSLDVPTVVIDWAAVVRPEWLAADGVHLSAAGEAPFAEFIRDGIEQCS
jgi:hypothetical protein